MLGDDAVASVAAVVVVVLVVVIVAVVVVVVVIGAVIAAGVVLVVVGTCGNKAKTSITATSKHSYSATALHRNGNSSNSFGSSEQQ